MTKVYLEGAVHGNSALSQAILLRSCQNDFEKAFDTVEWSFIEKTLQFYGFGPSLQKWIKTFYCDISSVVTNNGHVSELFSLRRGVLTMGMSAVHGNSALSQAILLRSSQD
jgi:hypothetical protein